LFSVEDCREILDRVRSCSIQYENESQGVRKFLPRLSEDRWLADFVLSKTQRPGHQVEIRRDDCWSIVHESSRPLGLHCDNSPNGSYQVLIPLQGAGSTILYSGRWPDATNFVSEPETIQNATNNRVVPNFGDTPFDLDSYRKHCSHIDYSLLSGLSIETVYEWKLGECFEFNRNIVHSSGSLTTPKIGLTIFFDHSTAS
jgi:hypothetical protein